MMANTLVSLHVRMLLGNFVEVSDKLAGKTPYSLDAYKNRGVSVVREDRGVYGSEFYNGQNTQDRFWKIEVKFNSDLDFYFGITHDKQSVKPWKEHLIEG